ncbi:hypothetical protein D3C87_1185340 [compost metagenome]
MDWRTNLNVEAAIHGLDDHFRTQIVSFVKLLGLSMGIIDAKLTPDGDLVFLEINPQGQFLFLEPMVGFDLKQEFASYLALGDR